MNTTAEEGRPLAGIRIIDLTSGTLDFCSRLLADMGACVIKAERPGGDRSRATGPFLREPGPGRSLSFLYHNAGKLGITLNLENSLGRNIFLRLLERTDVLVESFPPGYLAQRDLGIDDLWSANPRLIVVSITGFGQFGPRKDYISCDIVASAFGGQMAVTGSPKTPPLAPFGDQPSYTAALFGAVGILLAMRKRRQTGLGEHLDISLQEAAAATLDHVFARFFSEGIIARRQGNLHWNRTFCTLPCRNGHILVSLSLQWETLLAWMGSEGMAGDLATEPWRDESYRMGHLDHVTQVLERWTRTHTKEELFELGQALQFPWAPICTLGDVLQNAQLGARNFFITADDPDAGAPLLYPSLPFRIDGTTHGAPRRAPSPGEHNDLIYRSELGFSEAEMERLAERGVI